MPKASVKRLIDNRKDKLIEFVLDIEKYPEFIPWCSAVLIHSKTKKNIIADLMVKYKFFQKIVSNLIYLKNLNFSYLKTIEGP